MDIKAIFLDENSGSPSKPRNIGMDNASSEYIMFLDNDDEYDLKYYPGYIKDDLADLDNILKKFDV